MGDDRFGDDRFGDGRFYALGEPERQEWPEDAPRPGAPVGCAMCGSQPTASVSLRRQVGMVITRRVESLDGEFCRDCGTALFRSLTNRTLLTGWWGFVSFFTNFAHLFRNLQSSRRLAGLGPPHPGSATGPQQLPYPLDPGKPLTRRAGPWAVAIVVAIIAAGGIADALDRAQRDDAGILTRAGTLDIQDLRVGDCFNDPEDLVPGQTSELMEVRAAPCQAPHDNQVYHSGALSGDAYPGDDAAFEQAGLRCLDEFGRFVGMPYQLSVLDVSIVTPTSGSWATGDREFVCAVFDPAGPVTGTLQGANR